MKIFVSGTFVTVHGEYLHLHGPFEIRIGGELCPSVVVYV